MQEVEPWRGELAARFLFFHCISYLTNTKETTGQKKTSYCYCNNGLEIAGSSPAFHACGCASPLPARCCYVQQPPPVRLWPSFSPVDSMCAGAKLADLEDVALAVVECLRAYGSCLLTSVTKQRIIDCVQAVLIDSSTCVCLSVCTVS